MIGEYLPFCSYQIFVWTPKCDMLLASKSLLDCYLNSSLLCYTNHVSMLFMLCQKQLYTLNKKGKLKHLFDYSLMQIFYTTKLIQLHWIFSFFLSLLTIGVKPFPIEFYRFYFCFLLIPCPISVVVWAHTNVFKHVTFCIWLS